MLYAEALNCVGIKFLIDNGANIDAKDSQGRTMLHYLVQNDDSGEATEWLLKNYEDNININAVTNNGVTSLMLAVKRNKAKAASILLNNSANPFLKDLLDQEASDYSIATAV